MDLMRMQQLKKSGNLKSIINITMKRSILIVFISFICFQCAAQKCQEAYMAALQKYKNKNYVRIKRNTIINNFNVCSKTVL